MFVCGLWVPENLSVFKIMSESNPLHSWSHWGPPCHFICQIKSTNMGYQEVKGFWDSSTYSWEKQGVTISGNFWTHCRFQYDPVVLGLGPFLLQLVSMLFWFEAGLSPSGNYWSMTNITLLPFPNSVKIIWYLLYIRSMYFVIISESHCTPTYFQMQAGLRAGPPHPHEARFSLCGPQVRALRVQDGLEAAPQEARGHARQGKGQGAQMQVTMQYSHYEI